MQTIQIVVGGAEAFDHETSFRPPPSACSCRQLADLLETLSRVDSVITTGILPDGDYVDVVRLVASHNQVQPTEVIVVDQDGFPVLRFDIDRGLSKFERLWDLEASDRRGHRGFGHAAPVRQTVREVLSELEEGMGASQPRSCLSIVKPSAKTEAA